MQKNGRIFQTIRRQSKVVSCHNQAVTSAATSRNQNTGQIQQQATGATTGANLSRAELNVLKTMTAVIMTFMIFWCVPAFVNVLQPLGVSIRVGLLLIFVAELFSL